MRKEKPDVQGRCHRAECGKFGVNIEKFQSIPGIQTGTFSSIGKHATPTPHQCLRSLIDNYLMHLSGPSFGIFPCTPVQKSLRYKLKK